MFVKKRKIDTPRFPMLHHEESPEKPQYNMASPIYRQTPIMPYSPFSGKNFQALLFPSIFKKLNPPTL